MTSELWRHETWLYARHHDERRSTLDIAEFVGVTVGEVRRALRAAGVAIVAEDVATRDRLDRMMADDYLAGMSEAAIARRYGYGASRVRAALERTGTRSRQKRFPQLADKQWLSQRYVENAETAVQFAGEVGCTESGVRSALSRHDLRRT